MVLVRVSPLLVVSGLFGSWLCCPGVKGGCFHFVRGGVW